MIDMDYDNAMIDCVSFSYACEELLPVSRINHYYDELQDRFPLCHFVFTTIVSSSYYTIPTEKDIINEDELTSQVDLHREHRMLLSIFCSLLRAKSRDLLKHWAMCEPLAHFYKGFSQPSRKAFNGGFSSTLATCWKMYVC